MTDDRQASRDPSVMAEYCGVQQELVRVGGNVRSGRASFFLVALAKQVVEWQVWLKRLPHLFLPKNRLVSKFTLGHLQISF